MASQSSLQHSQEVIACQLCETNRNIRVKCLDCELLMCELCKNKIHAKFKNADNHTIVLLKDIRSQGENESKDFKLVKCEIHTNQFYCMFCRYCEKLVCPKCLSTEHKKHELTDIETICMHQHEQFADLEEQFETDVDQYLQKLETLSKIEESKYLKIRQRILNEEKEIKEQIQLKYATALDELEEGKKQIDKLLAVKKECISKEKLNYEKQRGELKHNFRNRDPMKILDGTRVLKDKVGNVLRMICSKSYKMKTFCSEHDMSAFKMNSTIIRSEIDLTIESTCEMNVAIGSIAVDNHRFLWIADGENVKQLDPSNNFKIRKQLFKMNDVNELRCSKTNNILLTTGTKILRLTSGDSFKTFRDFSPDRPFTLHFLKSNDIVVGMDHRQNEDNTNKLVIAILTSAGKIKAEYSNVNEMLMNNLVGCIASFKDDTVCFVDTLWDQPEEKGRVVRLNDNGSIEWTYSGTEEVMTEDKPFNPVEILVTENDNCLVSDKCNNAYGYFHILSKTGSVLSVLDLTLLDIQRADVMTLDRENHLWLTEYNRIHFIKFSGF